MAAEPGVSSIWIYGVPNTITPVITPTPVYIDSLHYETNCWVTRISTIFRDPTETYTISATGFTSKSIEIEDMAAADFEVTLTPAIGKPAYLCAYTDLNAKPGQPTTIYVPNTDIQKNEFVYNKTGTQIDYRVSIINQKNELILEEYFVPGTHSLTQRGTFILPT